ncbi:tetraacyldisaccharide 4'-kinase, partial [Citrobacter sp. AAK_AS5]
RGILREPLSALRRADIFVVHNPDQQPVAPVLLETLRRLNAKAEIVHTTLAVCALYLLGDKTQQRESALLKGRRVAVLCGI